MFKLGIITDEVSQDFEYALSFAKENGLSSIELRTAWDKNPFTFTDDDFEKIKNLKDKYSLELVCISSPVFKCSFFDKEEVKKHEDGLKRLVDKCQLLGCSKIRVFNFFKDAGLTDDMVKEEFLKVLPMCEEKGITLVLESEPSTNGFDCKSINECVEYINSPYVKAVYEPGNNIYSPTDEIPFPDGYNNVKDNFCHVHIKDAIKENGEVKGVKIGTGIVNYEGIVRALLETEYDGAVMFEPHYKKDSKISEEQLLHPGGSAFSEGGDVVSKECIESFNEIINKVKMTVKK